MKNVFIILCAFIFTLNIASAENTFTNYIEEAHKKGEFLSYKAISFDLEIFFGENSILSGKITTLTDSTKTRLDIENGTSLIYDGDRVYLTPSDTDYERARFDMFTWSYFFLFPYKLSDPGTIWNEYENSDLNGKQYNTQKLSFENGIGDSPDDWYIVYSDNGTNLIKYSAYIVTFTKSKQEAEKDPHAIEYTDYNKINGIPISTRWVFWGWDKEKGLTEKIGYASIENINFIEEIEKNFFSEPENSRVIE